MLTELRIENFAIIQHLELDLNPGLTTFTGETGAGKSIILDAIEALVGGRADPTQIRGGAERAILEAVFRIPPANREALVQILEREDLLDDADYLAMGREIRREGRSAARVNGRTVNVSLLRELGNFLVDIHGQSDHLSLLNVRQHQVLLDQYAGNADILQAYRQDYQDLLTLRRELTSLRQGEQDSARRAEMLAFQLNEIEAARFRPGEEEPMRHERDRLANAENLASLAQKALIILDDGNPETPALTDQLGEVLQLLASLGRIDHNQVRLHEQTQTLSDSLSEIVRDLHDYMEKIEFNPHRLEQVEERLDLLHTLKRKYGNSIENILAFAKDAGQKLETITHSAEQIAKLEAEEKLMLEKLSQKASQLSSTRHAAAEALAHSVEEELADLRMVGARLMVDLRREPHPAGLAVNNGEHAAFNENGVDEVEFLIAPNPGEGFKPMVKIASGGETSRLMLALKNVLARADSIPTLVFDEVDQGIGGRVGSVVGEKLWQLARQHQVFVVTHLPQLAAFGDQHYRVGKQVQDGRTITQVEKLSDANRLEELAQMLGNLSDANRKAAQEALSQACLRKAQLSESITE
ncbi:MAG: DNA repair protein RecN [Anaerolineaceae bacterium]|jgi:DNA repair protein RecN (Recombination protein N)